MTALTDLTDCVVNYTDQNMFLGQSSGGSITAANNSTSLGYLALRDVTSGDGNTAIGNQAMKGLTTGIQNVAVGASALFNDSFNGNSNVAIGVSALYSATTADTNIAIGLSALSNLTTGDNNILIGTGDTVGTQLTTGSNNILIGHQIAPSSSSVTNELNIGGTVVGNTSTKVLELQANLDANAKKITDLADPTTAQDAATKQYVDDTASAESGKWTVTTVTPSGDDVDLLTNIDSEGYTAVSYTHLTLPTNREV